MQKQIKRPDGLPDQLDFHAIQQAIARKKRVLCKQPGGFSYFVKEFWDLLSEDELEWAPHMTVLCDEIETIYRRVIAREQKEYDLIINVPPGTTKSSICTVMAPVWSWTLDRSLRHITGSYSADLSTEHAVKSRDIIRSDRYRRYFPEVIIKRDEDNKSNYKTINGGQRFATSVGGTVTGVHAHILTYDDPINPKQATSTAELSEVNRYFDQTLPTRKVDKRITPLILIMQRLDSNDPTGHLLEKKKVGIRHICLPGTISDNVKPAELKRIYSPEGLLDPVRLGTKVLNELKIDLGAYGYAGQIDQTPVPAGGLVWQKWFIEVPDELFPDIEKASDVATDWDTAFTDDEKNAASAFVKSGIITNRIYIFDFDWRWVEFPELIKWMKQVGGPHYIESKASGKSAKQTLKQQGIIAIEVKITGGNDKVARARAATPTAESGIVYIRKSMADKMYNDSKQGILHFPKGQYKDLADALAQMLQRRAKKGRIIVGNNQRQQFTSSDEYDEILDQPAENPLDWV